MNKRMFTQTMQFCSAFITFTLNFMTEITNFTFKQNCHFMWLLNDEMYIRKTFKISSSLIIMIEI